jgi:hypothetical protein
VSSHRYDTTVFLSGSSAGHQTSSPGRPLGPRSDGAWLTVLDAEQHRLGGACGSPQATLPSRSFG